MRTSPEGHPANYKYGWLLIDFRNRRILGSNRQLESGQLDPLALATAEEDERHPGQTQTLHFTFKNRTREFVCHLPGRYELGMMLPIAVLVDKP